MYDLISIRLSKELNKKLEKLAKTQDEDKSSIIRELLHRAVKEKEIELAIEAYKNGQISLWKAAQKAGVSLWKMTDIIKTRKIEINYSEKDLEEDLIG